LCLTPERPPTPFPPDAMLSRATLFAVFLATVAVCAAAPVGKAYSDVSGGDWTPDTGITFLDDFLNTIEVLIKQVFGNSISILDDLLETAGDGVASVITQLGDLLAPVLPFYTILVNLLQAINA